MENKKTVISVGAGPQQEAFIRRLKKRGYLVAAFGTGGNSEAAVSICDYFSDIDTGDEKSAVRWLDSLSLSYAGAGSYAGGNAIKTLQRITNHYGLPTSIPEEAVTGMEKSVQQEMYQNYHLSPIPTWNASSLISRENEIRADRRYIIKPEVGRGSAGVQVVNGSKLQDLLNKNSVKSDFIIQEYIEGKEYRVLALVQDGLPKLLAPVRRTSFKDTLFLGRLEITTDDRPAILSHLRQLVGSLRLTNAVIKYDILVRRGHVYLIEMDIGVGGGPYFKTYLSHVYGCDLLDRYIDVICGIPVPQAGGPDDTLVMDYVYNEKNRPVHYEEGRCLQAIQSRFGCFAALLVNALHPECKTGFQSNADFMMAVIHRNTGESLWEVNDCLNRECFL